MAEFIRNFWPVVILLLAWGAGVIRQLQALERIEATLRFTTEELSKTRQHYHDLANTSQRAVTEIYRDMGGIKSELHEKINKVKDDLNDDLNELKVRVRKLEP